MMSELYKKPELLAPGGNPVKARTALIYGADAVYIGGKAFGLRANADNFTIGEIRELVAFANENGKKVYVTLNILPRSHEIGPMCAYAKELEEAGVHGLIVSDLGAFAAIRKSVSTPIHVSTQASNLNTSACELWHDMGADRVNLARELSLKEIGEISSELKADGHGDLGLEVFVHGAMCMAYSGRCMLSDYMTGRSSNRGDCAQPCRWKYHLNEREIAITEDERPGQYFPIEETNDGTFLFNSKDLCLMEYLPELIGAGATALKIEGRMKSDFYVAITVRAYRHAIDTTFERLEAGLDPHLPEDLLKELLSEVCSVSHRDYSTGFALGERGSQVYTSSSYIRSSDFIGVTVSCKMSDEAGIWDLVISQRGCFCLGDEIEFISPSSVIRYKTDNMRNADDEPIARAPHPCMEVRMKVPFYVENGSYIRR